jgi:hypothetical protein
VQRREGQGIAVVAIQKTPIDATAAVRVFAKTDEFMMLVAQKLKVKVTDRVVHKVPVERPRKGYEAHTTTKDTTKM